MEHIFVDTDVLIDFLIDSAPFSEYISVIFTSAELKKIQLYTTGMSLSNAYYVLRKYASHKSLIDKFEKITSFVEIINLSKDSVLKGLKSDFSDLEDAFQNYSAEEHPNVEILLTRNVKDYTHSNLTFMTPEQYLMSK